MLREREGQGAEAGRQGGTEGYREDTESFHRRPYLITDADVRPAYFSAAGFGSTVSTGPLDMLPR
jgi:hypothetical protein